MHSERRSRRPTGVPVEGREPPRQDDGDPCEAAHRPRRTWSSGEGSGGDVTGKEIELHRHRPDLFVGDKAEVTGLEEIRPVRGAVLV